MTTKFHKLKLFLSVLVITILTNANLSAQSVGVNTADPHESALMHLESTDKGFLPPRMSTGQRDLIEPVAEGLMIYNTDNNCIEFFDGQVWRNLCAAELCAAVGGIEHGGKTYGTVYSPATRRCWLDRNLGATQVATASDDSDAYGDLFQWGRAADGHQIRTSGTTSTLSNTDNPGHGDFILAPNSPYDWRSGQNDDLWQGVNGTNNPCPPGWRIPTEAEWDAERLSWNTNNAEGAYASPLKLPVAGFRSYSVGSLGTVGSDGYYWSSTVDGIYSQILNLFNNNTDMGSDYRAYGLSIRCLKD